VTEKPYTPPYAFGNAVLRIHRDIIGPFPITFLLYGNATVRNVTPQLFPSMASPLTFGHPWISHSPRKLQPDGIVGPPPSAPLLMFRTRTVSETSWVSLLIGLATVRRFLEEGAKVVIGDVDDARGEALAGELGVTYVHVDVTSKEQVDALFATAKETYGSVDIAFNNAGISPPDDDSILDTELDAWRRVQDVNLTSVYLCCKAALPYMLEQGKGSIINSASFVAVMGAATSQISYSASKGGVLSMSRELGVQFAREGVRVNALCPGPVNTPLLKELFASDAERAARRLVHVPMGRFGEPEEMANAVLFLASDESSFMTANTFLVDGGISGAYVTPL
jgi:NAD(P)-dependent dehydrogenase (short-subunit alcohol dehydrogenase family)